MIQTYRSTKNKYNVRKVVTDESVRLFFEMGHGMDDYIVTFENEDDMINGMKMTFDKISVADMINYTECKLRGLEVEIDED